MQPPRGGDAGRRGRGRGPAGRVGLARPIELPEDLAAALREALEGRTAMAEMVAEGRPRKVFEEGSRGGADDAGGAPEWWRSAQRAEAAGGHAGASR